MGWCSDAVGTGLKWGAKTEWSGGVADGCKHVKKGGWGYRWGCKVGLHFGGNWGYKTLAKAYRVEG